MVNILKIEKMKERFKQIKKVVDGTINFYYIKEQKKHWWSKRKVVMKDATPLLFYKLPEGVQAVNESPRFGINLTRKAEGVNFWRYPIKPSPLPPPPARFPKGDSSVRKSMEEMVRNADEIYVGIKQDGVYYVAYDTASRENLLDLMDLRIDDSEDE